MKLLSFECSAKTASCAITEDGKLLGSVMSYVALTHSQTLMPMMENLLSATTLSLSDIDGFAVAAGPGSFTGIRIGISAVKGLAAAENKPCYPVSTLEAMVHQFAFANAIVCPVMDARCGQVYNALFRTKGGKITRMAADRAISVEELLLELSRYSEKIILIGDGTDLVYKNCELGNVIAAPEHLKYQSAIGVAFAAEKVEPLPPAELEAFYLRLPQAERELKKRSN
ncbi:MAG: tRNA (adenosine(37)-N6)-threonylcarbamoyltransferase complex dimerization subunit type 1 TsaB [Ruminococcaceae bacterium]|nr:tRNA (adenosine(37)-N6)-threonylcarbamoyltransferase complex dimerization subunit type 1 TsaB [Oscillospiraceae bacterium]